MTSEVVLMNRLGVALAADSAVTIPTGSGSKIFQSAVKLFTLSKRHPVGVMIYGSASIMDVPWETIIKMFRDELGNKTFPTVKAYASSFIDFLNSNSRFFPVASQNKHYLSAARNQYQDIYKEARGKMFDSLFEGTKKAMLDFVVETVARHHNRKAKVGDLPCFDGEISSSLKETFQADLCELIKSVFEDVTVSSELESQLLDLAIWLVTKEDFDEGYSGIVFAGFGDESIFPAMCSYKASLVVCDRAKQTLDNEYEIGDTFEAIILPFAQSEMIDTFIRGMDPRFRKKIGLQTMRLVLGIQDSIIDAIDDLSEEQKDHWRQRVSECVKEPLDGFFKEIEDHQVEKHAVPIYSAIRSLPKDELAATAEALVSLSSFQKRVSMDAETVAGPIDVAVISKGDGFIWIKRKHYFEPDLNYHFFQNYFRSSGESHRQEGSDESGQS